MIRSDQVICYLFAAINLLEAEKTTDKFSRKATVGKREGMSKEQLFTRTCLLFVQSVPIPLALLHAVHM
jgi:hypothetical protein